MARRRRQGDRALERDRDLRRQGHRLSPVEVWPAGPRLRLSARSSTIPTTSAGFRRSSGEADHPHFGGAQADLQRDRFAAGRSAGECDRGAARAWATPTQADHYTHFCYEMVALTPRCAMELGYDVSPKKISGGPISRSRGRKGFGVKADDLIDKLIAATQRRSRRAASGTATMRSGRVIAKQIADRRAALLHAEVHAQFGDRLRLQGCAQLRGRDRAIHPVRGRARAQHLSQGRDDCRSSRWRIWRASTRRRYLIGRRSRTISGSCGCVRRRRSLLLEQCIATAEPAYLAKHAFQLAQEFNNFYHKHHILTEPDPARKKFLLATAAVAQRELIRVARLAGYQRTGSDVEAPRKRGAPEGAPLLSLRWLRTYWMGWPAAVIWFSCC